MAALTAGTAVVAAAPATASPTKARFIITVADDADSPAVAAEHRRSGAAVDFVYTRALNGFAGAMSEADLGRLQRDGRVTRIERDGVASISTETTQTGATWGIDRIDARSGTDTTYSYSHTGAGVHAYVVDTGINLGHEEFTGRLDQGFDAFVAGGSADDCNGHGTHVAGTVGGTVYGVAKDVTLHPVRVLDCSGSGSWSGVIAGLDWVANNHVKPAVANMSLGGGGNTSVDDAVRRTIGAGVTVVVAAGNGNQAGREADACNYSPARVLEALTIGATTRTDSKTSFSNYGSCVDLFAPGASITSAWHTSSSATNTISGTSMAAPHVAGVAALALQQSTALAPPAVADVITTASTKGVVRSAKTANNHLLHSRVVAGTAPVADNAAPAARFTATCTDLTCSFDGRASSDSDGRISAYAWNFGNGTAGSGATATHTYATGGDYTVTLTVTDDKDATSATTETVTVIAPAQETGSEPAGPALEVSGYKVKGMQWAKLSWSGASSVDIYRNGELRRSAVTTNPYDDSIGSKGSGKYTYKVCATGSTTTCSAPVSVTF